MKVLILSTPRCYTKNVQDLVSESLQPDQLRLYNIHGRTQGHLQELLNLNECTVLGVGDDGFLETKLTDEEELKYHRPRRRADGHFVFTRCDPGWASFDTLSEILDHLESTPKDLVVKMFPHKLTEAIGLSEEEEQAIYRRVQGIFDVILPIMRLDNEARIKSSVASSNTSWDVRDGVLNRADAQEALDVHSGKVSDRMYAMWARRESKMRDCLLYMNLRPLWAEDLAVNAKALLAERGLTVNGDLPKRLEYSNLKETMSNRILIIGNSTIGKALKAEYLGGGDTAVIAGRSEGSDIRFDLLDKTSWSNVLDQEWNEVHFTAHTSGMQTDFLVGAQHFFERLMFKKTKVVFYTHRVASLSKSINIRTQSSKDSWFRIMKAALVMAALTAWNNERAKASLLVIDPGNFQSPLNPNSQTSAQERAVKIVEYCSAWRGGFNCVNTSNGEEFKL